MPLTRDFGETVMARVKSDPVFRSEMIIEATNAFLMDDMETGKALLRDYLNATESIAEIARELEINEKSLRRMLGPKGNPTLKNFLSLPKVCSEAERLTLQVCNH
jgi:DNA-binding phage protein